jgi:ubiquinone/menaquinone biosynthesis C-methylase UbiE
MRLVAALTLAVALSGCAKLLPGQDVRYSPTPHHVVHAMLTLANVGPDDVVYDLGSGDGRIIVAAAQEFGARGVGIEIVPELVAEATLRADAAGVSERAQFRQQDIFTVDVSAASVVTLYLSEELNARLRPKLLKELQPGARIVSYRVDMEDWRPHREIVIDVNENQRIIYLWTVPPR